MTDQIAHGRLMNTVYRRQRFIYDATRKYFLLGRDRLVSDVEVPRGGRVLEIACGTGRNLAAIGARHPHCALYGLDISSEMLATARRTMERRGLGARSALAEADACRFDPQALFGVPDFDCILLSYSLSMIPNWRLALAEAARHLAPRGRLHVVDFGDQAGLPRVLRASLRAWLARFHVAPRAELEVALRVVAEREGRRLSHSRLYRDYAQYAVLA